MIDNVYWLQYFNHMIGDSADLFRMTLFLSDRLPWLLYALALCSMWFAGTPGLLPERPNGLLRNHARHITLLTFLAMPVLFVISKMIQKFVDSTRPMMQEGLLQIPLSPKEWHAIIDSFEMQGSFPSDHAVVFFLLATVIFGLSRVWGVIALLAATFFSLVRIALGFHWPWDVLAGAILGSSVGLFVLLMAYMTDSLVVKVAKLPMKLWFISAVVYLFLYDCSYKFSHIMSLIHHDS